MVSSQHSGQRRGPARTRAGLNSVDRRITTVGRAGDDLLEGRAHRHIEIDAFWRDRLEKPLVIDRIDRAAAISRNHRLINDFLEGRVIAPQHDAVGLDRKGVGGDHVILRRLRASHQTVEQDVMTKAAARPVSIIRNASACSLAARMLRLRPF